MKIYLVIDLSTNQIKLITRNEKIADAIVKAFDCLELGYEEHELFE